MGTGSQPYSFWSFMPFFFSVVIPEIIANLILHKDPVSATILLGRTPG